MNDKVKTEDYCISQPRNRSPYTPVEPLPMAPMTMVPPPQAGVLASDGTMSIPVVLESGPYGWVLFDSTGNCTELVLFNHATERTRTDMKVMAGFMEYRRGLGDPLFSDVDLAELVQEVEDTPEGTVGHAIIGYHRVGDSPDGTRTVRVTVNEEPEAILVLDTEGCIVDGTNALCDCELTPHAEQLLHAFAARRIQAGDPWFDEFHVEGQEDGEPR